MTGGRLGWALALLAAVLVCLAVAPPASAVEVSLGDSYSSGEGAGDYDFATRFIVGDHCHRSPRAWPRLLGVPDWAHLACSGAKTINFFEAQTSRGPDRSSQLDRLAKLAASWSISRVYVTIGGNDLGFSSIFTYCLLPRLLPSCLGEMDQKQLPKLRGVVLPDVVEALTAVRQVVDPAPVLLVGYPDAIPKEKRNIERASCQFWLSDSERERIYRLESELDTTLATAARAAGVEYLPIRGALNQHWLCSKQAWINPIGPRWKPGYREFGHPNQRGQEAIEEDVAQALRTGAGIAKPSPSPPAGCVPAGNVAAIVDDSGSMRKDDPIGLREAALRLLIVEPGGQTRILGATEFGSTAGPLFAPGLIGASQAAMLASLVDLDDDGFVGGAGADYDAAFAASSVAQPGAGARILLSSGRGSFGPEGPRYRGGPPTYVIGLNAGPGGEGNEAADLLRRIATETGGAYFPLKRDPSDDASTQLKRLPSVIDAIDSLLGCGSAPESAGSPLHLVK